MRSLPAGPATLTILFTDLVSSTELRARLGDERADQLRREHDDLVTEAVERNDGTVVKGLGDGVMAAFAVPSAALAAAVAIQQMIDQRNAAAPVPLALRVGLSAGEVRVEGGDVFGTAVVEAARLCAAAEAHQILVAEVVRVLAGSRARAPCRPIGQLDLKGLGDAVPTVEVEWAGRLAGQALAFPEIPTFDRWTPLVGRRLERAAAQQALLGALAGRTSLLALRGAAGTGKTRLAGEVARRAAKDGVTVLYGRSDGTLEPHRPVVQALAHALDELPPERATLGLGPEHAALGRLFPVLEGLVEGVGAPRGTGAAALGELGGALGSWLRLLATDAGAVLVLDDLHLADPETLDLVAALTTDPGSSRLLVVAVAQHDPGVPDPLAGLVASARRAGQPVEELDLGALDEAAVDDLLGALGVADGADRRATASVLHRASGGSPLYVAELVQLLRGAGWLVPAADEASGAGPGTWRLAGPVPDAALPTGLDVLRARLTGLDPAARTVLRAAAATGLSVDLDLLAHATDADTGTVLAVLEQTDALRLTVRPPGTRRRRSFAHDAHRWLLDADATTDTVTVHARLAAAHEARLALRDPSAVFALARHRLASATVDRAGLEVVVRAAEASERRLAPRAAAGWYDHAVSLAEVLRSRGDQGSPGPEDLSARRAACLSGAAGAPADPSAL